VRLAIGGNLLCQHGCQRYVRRNRMQYTRLGRTGLQVSRLCLGTMNFGPQTSEADSFAIMNQALEQGINFIDTANAYGIFTASGDTSHLHLGLTEEIIGRCFAPCGRPRSPPTSAPGCRVSVRPG
jgi:aryl-alcohol dehydrogenase-like predicted oxidoreductase